MTFENASVSVFDYFNDSSMYSWVIVILLIGFSIVIPMMFKIKSWLIYSLFYCIVVIYLYAWSIIGFIYAVSGYIFGAILIYVITTNRRLKY